MICLPFFANFMATFTLVTDLKLLYLWNDKFVVKDEEKSFIGITECQESDGWNQHGESQADLAVLALASVVCCCCMVALGFVK